MPILMSCPNPECGRRSRVADSLSGRSVRCKACGQTFVAGDTLTHDSDRTAPPVPPPGLSGVGSVGRFRLQGQLGSGAFGTVYRAYDPHLDREVALKVPHPGTLDRPQRVERFLREAKAAANLRHPHIVPVYDAGKDGDRYYIASAFIDGKPLADEIPDGGLPFSRAARVAYELAGAVAYAHEQGVVHRDIKPANVMMDDLGRPHLMDFGLAARSDEASKLTSDGALMGTPAYMAPEQAAGQQGEASPAADQYALGVVLYELIAGRVPFEGPIPVVIHNQIHAEPDPPRKHRPDVPRDLETVCLKAMAKRPQDRYEDCDSLADDLRRFLEGEPIAARRLSGPERLARWVRKNPAVASLAAAVALLLVVGTATATVLAVEANAAAREAEAARDSEFAANESLALETARAKEAQRQAEADREAARKAKEDAEAAAAAAKASEARATESEAEAKRAREEVEEVLAKYEKAERERLDAANQLKGIELIKEERDYRTAVAEASRAVGVADFALAKAELAKCPERVRGPEWGMLRDWAALGRQPGREVYLPWPKWDDFHYGGPPRMFFSPDARHAAQVFLKSTSYKPETLVRIFDLNAPEQPPGEFRLSKDNFFAQPGIDKTVGAVTFLHLAFSPDGKTVASVWFVSGGVTGTGGNVRSLTGNHAVIHDPAGRPLARRPLPPGSLVALRAGPDGGYVVATRDTTREAYVRTAHVSVTEPEPAVTQYPDKQERYGTLPESVLSDDGRWLALPLSSKPPATGGLTIFDTSSGKQVGAVEGAKNPVVLGFVGGEKPLLLVRVGTVTRLYQPPPGGGVAWAQVAGSEVSIPYGETRLSQDGTRVLSRTQYGASRGGAMIHDPRDGFRLSTIWTGAEGDRPAGQPAPKAKYYFEYASSAVDRQWRRWITVYGYAEGKWPTNEVGSTRLWVWDVGTAAP